MLLLTSTIILSLLVGIIVFAVLQSHKIQKIEVNEHEELMKANQRIGDYENRIIDYVTKIHNLEVDLDTLRQDFEKLQHQKISADVKMGQKSENLLPFLSTFPYADDEIRGLFNPIDLIVFREDEVVFVEVKSGQSQLSDKQRKIRDQIKNGKVRFEIHRMDEKGVRIK